MSFLAPDPEVPPAEDPDVLKASVELWQAVLIGCRDAIFVSDENSRFVLVNPAACELTGYSEEELLDLTIQDLHEVVDQEAYRTFRDSILAGEEVITEAKILRKDGSKVPTEFNNRRMVLSGRPHMHTVGRDISHRKLMEEALRNAKATLANTNNLLTTVLEHTHVLVVYLDPDFNFVWVNKAYAETCGEKPEFFPGKNHFALFPHEENEAIFRRVLEGGEPFFVEAKPFEFPDQPERGATFWDWSLIPVFNGVEGASGLVLTVVEVTEKQRATEGLAKERRMRTALIDHLPFIAMILKNHTREIVYCNQAARDLGARPGTTCYETCMKREDPCPFCLAQELWETGEPQATEVKHEGKQLDCRWSPLNGEEYIHFIFDITDQMEQAEDLRDSRDRLREFGTRLDQVRDEERRALARELHDEVGQSLTAMRMDLRDLGKELPEGWENLEARIHSLIDISQDSVDRVNRMSSELRPPVLELLGLEPAIESEIWVFQEREEAEVEVELEIGELEPLAERDTTAVRTLKEALLNIRRHARAARVKVSLRVVGEAILLEVLDDGIGIETDDVLDHRSYGIVGMRERIERIGGQLQIGPRSGGGTRILAEIPLTPTNI